MQYQWRIALISNQQVAQPSSPLPQTVQALAIGHRPTPEAAQAEEFIGSMNLLIHERTAKIHGVGPQHVEEQLADRDASTQSYVVGSLAVHLRKHGFGNSIAPVVHRNQVWSGSTGE